jgi:crotonobetainyl-CoA:carnitine CoA-transferase CaiB-like acyl-CoA transferase
VSNLPADPAADWASSGVVPLTGWPAGPPLIPPGRAATVARDLAARFAELTGVTVDGACLLAERAALTGHRRRGRISAGGSCRLLPAADGWAAVSCARPGDADLLGALAGEDASAGPWPIVARWLREHSGAELAERAELLGIAAAPVGCPSAPPATPPATGPAAAGSAATGPAATGPAATGPAAAGSAAAGSAAPGPALTEPQGARRPLAGLLVADFSALWAGPLCAHLLGLAGARVIKVETPWRPDGARRGNAAFYHLLHAGHQCVALDPLTEAGRSAMAALVAAADIVIESSRPRALARFGLDAATAAASGTTWVSITAYGRASDRVGYGDDVAAGAGLVARDADGAPLFCGDAIADPLTGLAAAVAAASAPAGGTLLDISMSAVTAATLDVRAITHPAPAARQPSPAAWPAPPPWPAPPAWPAPAAWPASPARPSPAARRDGCRWVADTASGPVPVAPPRPRQPAGPAAALGEHTDDVLRELGVRR